MYLSLLQSLFTSYLFILRCFVAVVEPLKIQVLVLLQEFLKFILLGKGVRKKVALRTWKVTMIRQEECTQTQRVVSNDPCIIHLRRLLQVLQFVEDRITKRNSCHLRHYSSKIILTFKWLLCEHFKRTALFARRNTYSLQSFCFFCSYTCVANFFNSCVPSAA